MLRMVKKLLPRSLKVRITQYRLRIFSRFPDFCKRPVECGVVDSGVSPRIIVTLTSFPARIKTVYATLWTLLRQDYKPNKVILWLAREQFPCGEASLPKSLRELVPLGLTIAWCEDIRSYKKLVPALREYPDDVLVTADDDIMYPSNWLGRLVENYQKNPLIVHAQRIHQITFDEMGNPRPYRSGRVNISSPGTYFKNIPTTGGGVIYPPHVLNKDVTVEKKFMSCAPTSDDLWFWAMVVLNHVKIHGLDNGMNNVIGNYKNIGGVSLADRNIGSEALNDKHMAAIMDAYPEIGSLLER